MNKLKKFLLLCAAFAATLGVAACGGDMTSSSSDAQSSEPGIENSSSEDLPSS